MNEFADVMMLLRLINDHEAFTARLQQLQAAVIAADTRQAEAAASHAENDRERARLAQLEKAVRAREVEAGVTEHKNKNDVEEIRRWKRESSMSRLIAVGASGLTKEPDTTPVAPDPVHDPLSEAMDLEPVGPAARKGMRRVKI